MRFTLKRGLFVGATLVVGVLVIRWCQTRILPAPEAIQLALDDAVAATESNDIDRIMQHVHPDFRGSMGGEVVDRRGLKARLFVLLRRGIGVEIITQDVEEYEGGATVTLVVALWRGGLGGAASGDATAREIELDFRLDGSDWKVIESRQRPAEIEDVF